MTTTPPKVNLDDPPLPTVLVDVNVLDVLTLDRPDANDTDDEYDPTGLDDSDGSDDMDDYCDIEDEDKVASDLLKDPVEQACTTANKVFSANQDTGTPWKRTTHRVKEFQKSDHVKEHLLEELGPTNTVPRADIVQWVSSDYEHVATEDRISEFLRDSGEYRTRDQRWIIIPKKPRLEKRLYGPICELWNAILEYFKPPGIALTRTAFETAQVALKHHCKLHTSSPDISIEASGPSFTLAPGAMIGFSNLAAFADGKLDKEAKHLQDHMLQMGGYARQMFIQQPNRMFVRCLIITEHRARLFHFDRSGVQYSPLFNYHARPSVFIRLVLGLSSTDESLVGLDKSFQWVTGPQGVKIGGILETVRDDKSVIRYDLDMKEDIFNRTSIRGRGTVCWPVKDRETGERFLVKDYWMSEGRTPEYELLEEVKNTPGLCHMISHEEGRAETKNFRGDPSALKKGQFHNRKSIRITIKFYGTSIDNFRSPEEMLAALRDAIRAHQSLYSMGILHRDITHSNVLIGIKGFDSEDGERGVIIDLDMAIKNRRPVLDICKDFRTGTLMFQSIMITKFFQDNQNPSTQTSSTVPHPAQDYLDDLESFFWLFVFLLFIYKPNGEKAPICHFHETIWSFENEHLSYLQKSGFLMNPVTLSDAEESIDPDWHPACFQLFLSFHDFLRQVHYAKQKGIKKRKAPLSDGTVPNRYTDLLDDVNKDYGSIVAFFDEALAKLKEAAATDPLIESLDDVNSAPSSPVARVEPEVRMQTPRKPRTRSLHRGSPLLALFLTERTPKRKLEGRNSDTESDKSDPEESPTRRPMPKRICLPGPSGLSQDDTVENEADIEPDL